MAGKTVLVVDLLTGLRRGRFAGGGLGSGHCRGRSQPARAVLARTAQLPHGGGARADVFLAAGRNRLGDERGAAQAHANE